MPLTLAGVLGYGLMKLGAFSMLKYIAMRTALVSICLFLVPVAVYKGLTYLVITMMEVANQGVSGVIADPVWIQLTGVAGYLAYKCRIPEAMSIYLGFISLAFMLRLMRIR